VIVRKTLWIAAAVTLSLLVSGCSSSSDSEAKKETKMGPTPDVYKVNFDTSKGPIVVEVHRDWAPNGADHLYELVKNGFYDGDRFFRVVRGFVVQFGINGDPATNNTWRIVNIPDDRPTQANARGTLTYAATGMPNSRSTQLFFNLHDNSQSLNPQGFAPLGQVVSGMDVVDDLYAGYGEMAPGGQGPDPNQLQQEGNSYLAAKFPHLDYIKKATIQ
jgi:peptidyl-prolyl cis-trans isomerase A (cyclophilin A)